jgi:hypothetical protein
MDPLQTKPEVTTPPPTTTEPVASAETKTPVATPTTAQPETHLPGALQSTDTPFNSLQPAKDQWQLIWKGVSGLHILLGVLFIIFLVLRIMKLGGSEFSAGAVGTPFLILPALLLIDLIALGVYFVLKRPKMSELYKYAIWVGAGFGFAFLAGMSYVIIQSIS